MLNAESDIYDSRTTAARSMRKHRADVLEIFGGIANITACALQEGLRALQPVDEVHGLPLYTKQQFQRLEELTFCWLPFLTVIEISCTCWSKLTGLNYYWRPEELQAR